jgi:hypothetical protein
MSVESKIREFLNRELTEASFPGAGNNKEESPAMQGSSEKPSVEMMHKGHAGQTASSTAAATVKAGGSVKEASPMKQGSSEDAKIDSQDDQETQGKTQSKKMKKMPELKNTGAGSAPNFSTVADPGSVINQGSSKGNVVREDTDLEEVNLDDLLTEDEFEALSAEEQEGYEMVELVSIGDEELEEGKSWAWKPKAAGAKTSGVMKMKDKKGSEQAKKMKDSNAERREVAAGAKARMKEELEADILSLFGSNENLSEEFKTKATSLFEAVVTARVAELREEVENETAETAAEFIEEYTNDIVENVDAYLNYVTEQWMEQNAVAVEQGLRSEITEDFMNGLRNLFQENYIEVPEEKYDLLGEMEAKIEELTNMVNEAVAESIELKKELVESKRELVITRVSEDLALTEAEKLRALTEEVEFDNEELFEEKLNVIKNSYFRKNASVSDITEETSAINEETSSTVAKYAEVLSRKSFGK